MATLQILTETNDLLAESELPAWFVTESDIDGHTEEIAMNLIVRRHGTAARYQILGAGQVIEGVVVQGDPDAPLINGRMSLGRVQLRASDAITGTLRAVTIKGEKN